MCTSWKNLFVHLLNHRLYIRIRMDRQTSHNVNKKYFYTWKAKYDSLGSFRGRISISLYQEQEKAGLAFITLSSPITILPFRVNNLHVSNATSRFPTNAWIFLSFIITAILIHRGHSLIFAENTSHLDISRIQ